MQYDKEKDKENGLLIQIYYWDRHHMQYLRDTTGVTIDVVKSTHVKMPHSEYVDNIMCEYYEEDNPYKVLEHIFSMYNNDGESEMKNPLRYPEGQEFVHKNQTHTSMSVGDVVQLNEWFYVCEDAGWRELDTKVMKNE